MQSCVQLVHCIALQVNSVQFSSVQFRAILQLHTEILICTRAQVESKRTDGVMVVVVLLSYVQMHALIRSIHTATSS
jgi:hypothetical protein